MMQAGWGADFPTGYGYLQRTRLTGGRSLPNGNNNFAELNDPDDQRPDRPGQDGDRRNKAAAIWTQIDKKVMERRQHLPFVCDKALNYRNPRLTNVFVERRPRHVGLRVAGRQRRQILASSLTSLHEGR